MAKTTPEQAQETAFSVQKVYVKDSSFESPMSPHIFTQQATPTVDIQAQIQHNLLDQEQGYYEAILAITVTAKLEDKTAFLAEVHQAGIFQIKGVPKKEFPAVLEIACPNILLPFAREAVADVIGKGGFPQLLINPINFEVLYQQKLQHEASQPAQKQHDAGKPAPEAQKQHDASQPAPEAQKETKH